MLAVIYRVGTNVGIIDTADGVIENVTMEKLGQAVNSGMQVAGVTPQGIKAQQVEIPMNLCNWDKGHNIFDNATIAVSGSNFVLWSGGGKKYKGVVQSNGDVVILGFSNNVLVRVSMTWVNQHIGA